MSTFPPSFINCLSARNSRQNREQSSVCGSLALTFSHLLMANGHRPQPFGKIWPVQLEHLCKPKGKNAPFPHSIVPFLFIKANFREFQQPRRPWPMGLFIVGFSKKREFVWLVSGQMFPISQCFWLGGAKCSLNEENFCKSGRLNCWSIVFL